MLALSYDVVIPTRGQALDHLRATVDSVLAQTVPPARVIVVVDGRKEAEGAVKAVSPTATVLCLPEPGGAAVARQAGIAAATAEWVCFVDDDDLWRPVKMQVTAEYLSRHPECAAVRGSFFLFCAPASASDEINGQQVDFRATSLPELERAAAGATPCNDFSYLDIEGDSLALLLERNRSVIGTTCVRRAVLESLPAVPPRTHPGDDHLLACFIAARTEFHLIDQPLMYYRLHAQQSTRTAGSGAARNIIRSRVLAWEYCGPAVDRDLESYGPTYRREFRGLIWLLVRRRRLVEAVDAYRALVPLLPRLRDRLAVLVPEPLAWRWRKFVRTVLRRDSHGETVR